MSLDDLKQIDWKNATTSSIPPYVLIGAALVALGVILVVIGIFI